MKFEWDGQRLDAMTDDMINTSYIPPLTDKFFATAKWRKPKQKVQVTVEVDPEIIAWFKAQGDDYGRYLTAALRIYAEAHQLPEKVGFGVFQKLKERRAFNRVCVSFDTIEWESGIDLDPEFVYSKSQRVVAQQVAPADEEKQRG